MNKELIKINYNFRILDSIKKEYDILTTANFFNQNFFNVI